MISHMSKAPHKPLKLKVKLCNVRKFIYRETLVSSAFAPACQRGNKNQTDGGHT